MMRGEERRGQEQRGEDMTEKERRGKERTERQKREDETEGQSVTLQCKFKAETVFSVDFYKNDSLIQNDARRELTIPAVSMSDEGFYKCKGKHSGQGWLTSSESWMSVKCEYDQISFSSIFSLSCVTV